MAFGDPKLVEEIERIYKERYGLRATRARHAGTCGRSSGFGGAGAARF